MFDATEKRYVDCSFFFVHFDLYVKAAKFIDFVIYKLIHGRKPNIERSIKLYLEHSIE